MGKKIVLGGLAGAIVAFVFLGFLHMATHLGEVGVTFLPDQAAALPMMRMAIHEPGMYMFPGDAAMATAKGAQQKAAMDKYQAEYKQGPTGILIYIPGGQEFSFGHLLVNQFGITLLAALVVAWMLGMAAGSLASYGSRVLFVALPSVFAGIFNDLPYWNWYNFPANYTVAHILGNVVCWVLAGLVMAKIIKS